jgi:hypothetical protein
MDCFLGVRSAGTCASASYLKLHDPCTSCHILQNYFCGIKPTSVACPETETDPYVFGPARIRIRFRYIEVWIRIRIRLRIRTLLSPNSKKNLYSYGFVTYL